jgi:hypothetical protein
MKRAVMYDCGGVIRDARVTIAYIDTPSTEHVALACNGKCGKVLLLKGIRADQAEQADVLKRVARLG